MLKKIFPVIAAFFISCAAYAVPVSFPTATSNQRLVADQFESITDPTSNEQILLGLLEGVSLSNPSEAERILSQLSGQQYTTLFTSMEIVNRQFLRRLYDPLRPLVTNPDSCNDEVYDLCSSDGIKAWAESSVNRSFLEGNKNAQGFKMSGYEISVGAQKRLSSIWTLGAGFCYSIDHFHYNVGGGGKTNTVLGGVYTLYRPANYYVLGDVTFGYATNSLHRRIAFSEDRIYFARSKPNISAVSFYGEAGFDIDCECVLIQPFAGFEANRFKRNCKFEHPQGNKEQPYGNTALLLIYSSKDVTNAYSRLGVHFTLPENCYDLFMSFDLAWQYRLTSSRDNLLVRFQNFGVPFDITGVPNERNSMSFAYSIWSEVLDGWTLYLEASGERWKRVSNYEFTGGLIFKW